MALASILRYLADFTGTLLAATERMDSRVHVPAAGVLGEVVSLAEVVQALAQAPALAEQGQPTAAP
eukprot:7585156-Alexandrium_andersonii.AAC.1